MRRALLTAISLVGLSACKTVPLSEDPTASARDRRASAEAVYAVEWWKPLVQAPFLEYEPQEPATPAVDPDSEKIVVSTRDGFVRCLSPVDGRVEWEKMTKGRFEAGATVFGGVAYAPGGDGVLYAFSMSTGALVWSYDAKEELVTRPVIAEGKVLVASQHDTLFAVDQATGSWVWQYRRDMPAGFTIRGASRPSVDDGSVYMGFADGSIVALDAESGVIRWEKNLASSKGQQQFLDADSPVLVEGDRLYVTTFSQGVFALDSKTGDIEWSSSRPGLNALAIEDDALFAAGDGSLTALRRGDGRVMWSVNVSDVTPKGRANNAGKGLTVMEGQVVVPTTSALAFVDGKAGRVRAMWNPGRGVSAAPGAFASTRTGNRLYVLSNAGGLFALRMLP